MVDLALDFDKLANQIGGFGAEQVIKLKRKLQQIAVARGQNYMTDDVKGEFFDLQSEVVSVEKLRRMAETLATFSRNGEHSDSDSGKPKAHRTGMDRNESK